VIKLYSVKLSQSYPGLTNSLRGVWLAQLLAINQRPQVQIPVETIILHKDLIRRNKLSVIMMDNNFKVMCFFLYLLLNPPPSC